MSKYPTSLKKRNPLSLACLETSNPQNPIEWERSNLATQLDHQAQMPSLCPEPAEGTAKVIERLALSPVEVSRDALRVVQINKSTNKQINK
jgi:hypothetical protein